MGSGKGKARRARSHVSDALSQVELEISNGLLSVLVPGTESRLTLCNEAEMPDPPIWFATLSGVAINESSESFDATEAIVRCVGEAERESDWVRELARLAERSYA